MVNNKFTDRFIEMVLLKEHRESLKDINLTRLAKKMKVPVATFHQWLTGAFPKRNEHWQNIYNYFNCNLTFLITGIAKDNKVVPNEGKIIISTNGENNLECRFEISKNSKINFIR